ncbi:hypothetical protein [Lacinutrix venerupis]|uniref:Uncharacterized protein n=1 Tax=Lacinutrix venerupis TaxID=1486034 RepID=A0AAC9LNG9_9FLAO|nr:hypothetical protein [Lacinutrix venerupis]APY00612.1 hypothetical protein BWR22_09915 [Lacinutrix venerupis]
MIKLPKTLLTLFCVLNIAFATASNKEHTNPNPIKIHNAEIGIFPGDSNNGRKLVLKTRFLSLSQDVTVSGIKAAKHGKKILVVATNGAITFLPNNSSSSSSNRILYSPNMTIPQGDAFELTYNGYIKKWVITNTNPD